ncbi:MAG: hypothetical protein ACK48W_07350 [Bacteroidota bacterium]|jgi:hypothetical protein
MKFLVFILATFILFLAIKPGVDLLSFQEDAQQTCCDEQCSSTSQNEKSQNQTQDNDCGGKSCNPFQVCGSCVLVCVNFAFYFISKASMFSKKGFTYQSIFSTQYTSDFWQPPKIVYYPF